MSGHPTPRRSASAIIKIGNDDPTLTGHAGLLLTGELVRRLEVVETIEEAVNRVRPFKQRQRGLNAGELMVSLAETVMVGGDHLVHLDQLRGDLAGAELRAVAAAPAPTTAGQLLKRFQAGQCLAAVAAMAELGNASTASMGAAGDGGPSPKGQMEVLERGRVGYVFSYSFLLTDKLGDAAEIERWHRQRAHIEERIKEAKNGCGLIHLPMREAAANRAWQAATVVAHNLVATLAVEVAAGNQRRLRERVADAIEEDDLRHAASERARQPPARPTLADQRARAGGPPRPSGLRATGRRHALGRGLQADLRWPADAEQRLIASLPPRLAARPTPRLPLGGLRLLETSRVETPAHPSTPRSSCRRLQRTFRASVRSPDARALSLSVPPPDLTHALSSEPGRR
ncbi:MAG TPA: transposase [Methylomirabilota bacterium]|nr:transposase [Methylomirabilota bacterium]